MNKKKILKACCSGKGGCGKGGPITDKMKSIGSGILNVAATPARVAVGAIKGAVAGGVAAGAKSMGKAKEDLGYSNFPKANPFPRPIEPARPTTVPAPRGQIDPRLNQIPKMPSQPSLITPPARTTGPKLRTTLPRLTPPVELPNKNKIALQPSRPWGVALPGRSYPAVEGPGNPSWERRNPKGGAKGEILRKAIRG